MNEDRDDSALGFLCSEAGRNPVRTTCFGGWVRMHKSIVAFGWLLVWALANTGCDAAGLQRTNLDDWEVKELRYLGVEIDVPVNAYSLFDIPGEGSIQMHPFFPSRFTLDEPRCILEVGLFRLSEDERLADRWMNSGGVGSDEDSRKYWEWYYSTHHEVSRYDKGGYAYFRFDVRCSDGTTLMIDGTLVTTAEGMTPRLIDDDDAAIRRILGSAKCIEPRPMPTSSATAVQNSSGSQGASGWS